MSLCLCAQDNSREGEVHSRVRDAGILRSKAGVPALGINMLNEGMYSLRSGLLM